MKHVNLFWAIVWTLMAVFALVAFFWNWAHIFTAAFSAIFAVMFWHDYRKTKNL